MRYEPQLCEHRFDQVIDCGVGSPRGVAAQAHLDIAHEGRLRGASALHLLAVSSQALQDVVALEDRAYDVVEKPVPRGAAPPFAGKMPVYEPRGGRMF